MFRSSVRVFNGGEKKNEEKRVPVTGARSSCPAARYVIFIFRIAAGRDPERSRPFNQRELFRNLVSFPR